MQKTNRTQQDLYQAATVLFTQHGWTRVSIEDICHQAQTSRVTFYKYFRNKKELLKEILIDHKDSIRAGFARLAEQETSLEAIIAGIYALQKQALQGLYSAPMLHDMATHKDAELAVFFQTLEADKYQFMAQFFHGLQQKKLVNDRFPVPLIDAYLKLIDQMMHSPAVQAEYADKMLQLPNDVLQLMIYGFAHRD
ncbi:MAG: TetR/AcrR family transcriptional regulator [Neisseriaceae bacterium]|nr:TetR/AcrR family transcriptional regulator [Neisseriaceae bacterium]